MVWKHYTNEAEFNLLWISFALLSHMTMQIGGSFDKNVL